MEHDPVEIIASPGTQNHSWGEIEKKIEQVKPFIKTIHVDVVDGKFADNITFSDPQPFSAYTKDIFFEVHLMVEDPLSHLKKWADAGFRRFIGHVERMPDQVSFVAAAQELGEVGLALDAATPIEAITVPLIDLDTVLCMTIQAGFSGQTFNDTLLTKVTKLAEVFPGPIEVDGGITNQTIMLAKHAGARRFVTTSYLFNHEDIQSQYRTLTALVTA